MITRVLKTVASLVTVLFGTLLAGQPGGLPLPAPATAGKQVVLPRYRSVSIANPDQTPAALLARHAHGLQPEDLQTTRTSTAADGHTYVRYQQYHQGAPVLGGELVLQLTPRGKVARVSGYLADIPDAAPAAPAAPNTNSVPDDELEQRARRSLVADYPRALQWNTRDHGDAWTRRNPWAAEPLPYHRCRVIEVREPAGHRAEMVYLDLRNGKVIFRHQLHCSLQRRLYHGSTAGSNLVWAEGNPFPGSLNAEDTEMITATRETYSLFFRTFGRNSYNGTGGPMRAVTQATISGCPNARAFNNIILNCDGVVGDDIVGHEWTHNYTTQLNGLLFGYESGSIQEGLSDIFGEAVDLLNDRGQDANDHQRRDSCFTTNYRWCLAEDATAIDTILRDLWAPECKTDPATRNSQNFDCPDSNGQDIHSNSLLVSRTFALLTDGDTTTTDTIHGIGLTKALHIFYHANANYVTRVTDFPALAAMLRLSARDLLDVNLRELTLINTVALLSDEFITERDLTSLDAAIAATGLDLPAPCPALPTLAQAPPAGCEQEPVNNIAVLFHENWESGSADWGLTETPVHTATWDPKPWRLASGLPDGRPGLAMFAPNLNAGNCQNDRDNGTVDLTSPEIELPADQTSFRLRFNHYYSIEEDSDGGRLSMSRNGEAFSPLPPAAFLYNGYDGNLDPAVINDNPLAGEAAFTGADALSLTGTWGTSLVDLTAAGAVAGDRIRLRWTLGHDGCEGWLGWFLDEVTIGYCGEALLPVEYLFFEAEARKDRVDLSWATATEEDNAGFFVERRTAEQNSIHELGFVAAGTAYRFSDYDVRSGQTYYYRLRQTDLDGAQNTSTWVTATVPEGPALLVYPNPAYDRITVSGNVAGQDVSLHDAKGGRVRWCKGTNNGAVLEVGALPAGVYWLRAGEFVQRVIVK